MLLKCVSSLLTNIVRLTNKLVRNEQGSLSGRPIATSDIRASLRYVRTKPRVKLYARFG